MMPYLCIHYPAHSDLVRFLLERKVGAQEVTSVCLRIALNENLYFVVHVSSSMFTTSSLLSKPYWIIEGYRIITLSLWPGFLRLLLPDLTHRRYLPSSEAQAGLLLPSLPVQVPRDSRPSQ